MTGVRGGNETIARFKHQGNKCAHGNYRGKSAGAGRHNFFVSCKLCAYAAKFNLFFVLLYAEPVYYVFFCAIVGQNVFCGLF